MQITDGNDREGMLIIGGIVARVLDTLCQSAAPGMSTGDLDALAGELLFRHGADATPRKEYGFPGWLCISVNDEAVHGIPGSRELRRGDLIKMDLTADRRGYVADAARMVVLGEDNPIAVKLIDSTRRACRAAIALARPGVRLGDLGAEVERVAREDGFNVIREFFGHGVGRHTHEEPAVPNFDDKSNAEVLEKGMVIAIEPIFSTGSCRLRRLPDGWTMTTDDGSLTGHYEETVLVGRDGGEVLTTWEN